MSDNEIIKALEECGGVGDCKGCSLNDLGGIDKCISTLAQNTLALINRQKAEIERLISAVDNSTQEFLKLHDEYQEQKTEIESLSIALEVTRDNLGDTRKELNKAETEIERLKSMNQSKLDMIHDLRTELETARAEAIKEFADRLKESAFDCDVSFGYGREHYEKAVAVIQIDNLVKEMVGEQRKEDEGE